MGRYSAFEVRSSAGRSRYINLRDGDSVRFVVPSQDPALEETWWAAGAKVEHDHPEAKISRKAVLSVYDLDQQCPRVLRLTMSAWKKLAEKLDRHGDDRPYILSRCKGPNGFPEYTVDHEDRLSPAQLAVIAREPLIDVLGESDVQPWVSSSQSAAPAAPAPAPASAPAPAPAARREVVRARKAPRAVAGSADDDIPF